MLWAHDTPGWVKTATGSSAPRSSATTVQASGIAPPGEHHPCHPLGTVGAVDDPADQPEHKNGEEDQHGQRRHARPDQNSSGKHPRCRPARLLQGALHGAALPRRGERSARLIGSALRSWHRAYHSCLRRPAPCWARSHSSALYSSAYRLRSAAGNRRATAVSRRAAKGVACLAMRCLRRARSQRASTRSRSPGGARFDQRRCAARSGETPRTRDSGEGEIPPCRYSRQATSRPGAQGDGSDGGNGLG
jgi:hypothetical protein